VDLRTSANVQFFAAPLRRADRKKVQSAAKLFFRRPGRTCSSPRCRASRELAHLPLPAARLRPLRIEAPLVGFR